ncbi:unknown [Feldmannia species virus]|uniref:Uncharacterized protein n=1 Tax=Feldmannia species virus TaxID=39420 RepID=B5LWD2_9PHYC|nr:hypothetical protein FeldSpV_gp043 [Feldmannia species virus]ACH46795.1 unknown [Feldmannia species virus]
MGLPNPLFVKILEFSNQSNPRVFRQLSKAFREILDDRDTPEFKCMCSRYRDPQARVTLLWSSSVGSTALILRHSFLTQSCVSCSAGGVTVRHPFYKVWVCEICSRLKTFRVERLRTACDFFFLDYKQALQNNSLVTVKVGRSTKVLFHQVEGLALETYPDGELECKLQDRTHRFMKLEVRRMEFRKLRLREGADLYRQLVATNPARVDPILRKEEVLQDLVRRFRAWTLLYGDYFEQKISCSLTPRQFAQNEMEFAGLLTYMKKTGLLDVNFTPIDSELAHPRHIFMKYASGGSLHFYEHVQQISASYRQFLARHLEVREYIAQNKEVLRRSRKLRRQLAVAMCVEDNVDYKAAFFTDFVESFEGNPCITARLLKRSIFLDEHGYQTILSGGISLGLDIGEAIRRAKMEVLDETLGFPPWFRVCVINLCNSPC